MKYMGSKNRHAKYILPIILKDRKPNQYYVEPFCGGCNILDKADNPRIGNDSHYYLIEMWRALQQGWTPPQLVTEEQYKYIRDNPDENPALTGYIGFNLSYGGKWWGGYRRDKTGKRNYSQEAYKGIIKQIPKLKGVEFYNVEYNQLELPPNSIIYNDPPYANTTKYKGRFDHDKFWVWVREISQHHTVFTSEYTAPPDFECIWQREINNTLVKDTGSKKGIERLFIYKGNL